MTDITRKYVNKYLKRNALLILFCALPIAILFFIVSLLYDVLSYDMWLTQVPFCIGLLCFLLSSLYVFRFLRLIKRQESLLGVSFSDEGSVQLSKTLIFLSNEWLICAGSCAFHKKYIKSFSQKKYSGNRGGSGYKVTVKTVDGKKYSFWTLSYSDINTFRKWKKENDNVSVQQSDKF